METQPLSDRFELRHAATDRALRVTVPARRLLAIDGFGPPGTPDFLLALQTLRLAEHAIRAKLAATGWRGLVPAASECIWRPGPDVDSGDLADAFAKRGEWRWMQLAEVQPMAERGVVLAAIDEVRERAGRDRPLIRVVDVREDEAFQILAVGGPVAETDAVGRLVREIHDEGGEPDAGIHQIFVSDPARVPRDRWRSILRIPILPSTRPGDQAEGEAEGRPTHH